jgi:hypothetical protein
LGVAAPKGTNFLAIRPPCLLDADAVSAERGSPATVERGTFSTATVFAVSFLPIEFIGEEVITYGA